MALSVEELAWRAGTSAETVRRFSDLGILGPGVGDGPTDSPDAPVREDDAELLLLLERFLQQSLDPLVAEQVTLRYFFVIAEAARKVAEGGREMWRKGVEEPMLARGLTANQYLEAIAAPGPESQRLVDPMLMLLFHRFLESEIVGSVMEHLEAAPEEAGIQRPRQEAPPAISFLDLTGYTKMTEDAGDEAAADHAHALVDLVRRTSVHHGGRLVKMLGDGAMFHFARWPPCDVGSSSSSAHLRPAFPPPGSA